jgi:hypothetical protein
MIIVDGTPSSKHPSYVCWAAMLNRCLRRKDSSWPRYGGRGIKVCERWMDFSNFVADMGVRPPHMTVHRINNDKNYGPDNCVWATRREQSRHTSANRLLTFKGETHPLAVWAEKYGMNYDVLYWRIVYKNWPIEDALTLEVSPYRGKSVGQRLARIAKRDGTLEQLMESRRLRDRTSSDASKRRQRARGKR